MKIAVCVKQVASVTGYVEFNAECTDIDPAFVTREVNEADLCAVEAALTLREAAGEGEVVVLTADEDSADNALRKCLAMGADRALRAQLASVARHEPISVARHLAATLSDEAPNLVLCGVQSSDSAQQSTGPALASALGFPCITVAVRLEWVGGRGAIRVEREFEGGFREAVEVDLPALITVQTGMNTPRYGSFLAMRKAKSTPVPVIEEAGQIASRAGVHRMFVPEDRVRSVDMIDGGATQVAERIVALVREAKA